MTFVEHADREKYPIFVWAKDISVRDLGAEIEVAGTKIVGLDDDSRKTDALRAYRTAIRFGWGDKRRGTRSPHIQFANAETDEELLSFVNQYGPVTVASSIVEGRQKPVVWDIPGLGRWETQQQFQVVSARQSWSELRSERRAYATALKLIGELDPRNQANVTRIREYVLEIISHVSMWPLQWEREKKLRESGVGYLGQPQWFFGKENLEHLELDKQWILAEPMEDPIRNALMIKPVHAAHSVICELVNAFRPIVYTWGNVPVEAPQIELETGIRPILYYILRRVYLQGGTAMCQNSNCRQIFEIERAGQEYCSETCSQHQRQREYWKARGKKLRKARKEKLQKGRGKET